jgi:hypothetical protein
MGRAPRPRASGATALGSGTPRAARGAGSPKILVAAAVLAVFAVVAATAVTRSRGDAPDPRRAAPASYAAQVRTVAGLQVPARVDGAQLQLAQASGFADRFWPGVNLGSTTPGAHPGELRLPRATLDRWLREMGSFGVRVVRVYTILPPAFYDALGAYNTAHPDAPLWLVQGVWIPEEEFLAHRDLYRASLVGTFEAELDRAVSVVHGDAVIAPEPGHASGTFRTDVSRWLLAWSPGVEWDPVATMESDRRHANRPAYRGRYVTTRGAPTPTESWLAQMLDHLASREAARGWSRPITFTNWLTTDPLAHPEDPDRNEDLVSIDAMHLAATPRWPGGFFASYHAYPYYPDFLDLSRDYAEYQVDGKPDAYAGYLHALRAHHDDQAVMITEFGVPSGLGVAHRGPGGRDQGDHSERESMQIDADMLRLIHREGFAGGIVFAWTDEWFKHTWNTQDLEVPVERRALWRNTYTNEEHFGIVAQDARLATEISLDGVATEWTDGFAPRLHRDPTAPVTAVDATHDEEHLYLHLEAHDAQAWDREPIVLAFDVAPGGNELLPDSAGRARGSDAAVVVGPGNRARLLLSTALDGTGSPGAWHAPRLVLRRDHSGTGSAALETADISVLPWGNGDPRAAEGDTRNLAAASGTTIELRIPWMLLGYADPSSHLVRVHDGTRATTTRTGRVAITIALAGATIATSGYDWDDWNTVQAHERRKQGTEVLRDAFAALANASSA